MQSLFLFRNRKKELSFLFNHKRINILNHLCLNVSGKKSPLQRFQNFSHFNSSFRLDKYIRFIEKFSSTPLALIALANKIIYKLKLNFFWPTGKINNFQTSTSSILNDLLFKISEQTRQQDPFRSNSSNNPSSSPSSNNNNNNNQNNNNRNVVAALISLIVSMVLFYFIEKSLEKAQAEMRAKNGESS